VGGPTGSVGLTGALHIGQTSGLFSFMTWVIGHRDDGAHMEKFS